jgi:zinc transport system substrate-binding protein
VDDKFKRPLAVFLLVCVLAGVIIPLVWWFMQRDNRISIVCTIFPIYDMTRTILGDNNDNFKITYLLQSGVDMHNYENQKSVKDIVEIKKCDLLIYVGGESDEWIDALLSASDTNPDMKTIKLTDVVETLDEETIEGMEADPDEGDECDEHVWLSLRNAQQIVTAITNKICVMDEINADIYRANKLLYNTKLNALDTQYTTMVNNAKTNTERMRDTILFADRFPFLYLVRDYEIEYFSAFRGCSAQTEASPETIAFLVNKVNTLQLNVILVTEQSNWKIANTVNADANNNPDRRVLVMSSGEAVTVQKAKTITYLGMMTTNLAVLTQALG